MSACLNIRKLTILKWPLQQAMCRARQSLWTLVFTSQRTSYFRVLVSKTLTLQYSLFLIASINCLFASFFLSHHCLRYLTSFLSSTSLYKAYCFLFGDFRVCKTCSFLRFGEHFFLILGEGEQNFTFSLSDLPWFRRYLLFRYGCGLFLLNLLRVLLTLSYKSVCFFIFYDFDLARPKFFDSGFLGDLLDFKQLSFWFNLLAFFAFLRTKNYEKGEKDHYFSQQCWFDTAICFGVSLFSWISSSRFFV